MHHFLSISLSLDNRISESIIAECVKFKWAQPSLKVMIFGGGLTSTSSCFASFLSEIDLNCPLASMGRGRLKPYSPSNLCS